MATAAHFSDWLSMAPSSINVNQLGLDASLASQGVAGVPLSTSHVFGCSFDAVPKDVDDHARKNLNSLVPIL